MTMEFEPKANDYREHSLVVFKAKDNGEVVSRAEWKFDIYPNIVCTKCFDHFPDGRVAIYEASEKELEHVTNSLKHFLFKQKSSPTSAIWQIEPEFNEDEKRQIMRLSLFDTL